MDQDPSDRYPVTPGPGRKSTPSKPSTARSPWMVKHEEQRDRDPEIDIVLSRTAASALAARLGVPLPLMVRALRRVCGSQSGRRVLKLDSQRHWILLDQQLRRTLAEQEASEEMD